MTPRHLAAVAAADTSLLLGKKFYLQKAMKSSWSHPTVDPAPAALRAHDSGLDGLACRALRLCIPGEAPIHDMAGEPSKA